MALLPPPLKPIGKIISCHGFNGEIVVDWFTDDLELKKGDFLFVIIDKKGVPFSIKEIKGANNILKLEYIESEEDSRQITGCKIGIETNHIEEIESEWQDFSVFNNELYIGKLIRLEEYPQQTMLIIANSQSEEILIPFVENWLIEVSEFSQLIRFNLPEGLVE